MIKIFKNKFLISILVLVVTILITSSCYADNNQYTFADRFTATINESNGIILFEDSSSLSSLSINISSYLSNYSKYYVFAKHVTNNPSYPYAFYILFSNNFVWSSYGSSSPYNYCYNNLSDVTIIYFKFGNNQFYPYDVLTNPTNTSYLTYSYMIDSNDDIYLRYSDNATIMYSNHSIYGRANSNRVIYSAIPDPSVTGSHIFLSDTSASVSFSVDNAPAGSVLKYSLVGVEPQLDLNEPLQLINAIEYNQLNTIRVRPNTKVYYILYDSEGEVILSNYYQVPEYNAVIENADKDFSYTVSYNQDYSKATVSISTTNVEFSDNLYYSEYGLISNDYEPKLRVPSSREIEIDHNCSINILLYDPFNNLIKAKHVVINEIGNINPDNFKVDVKKSDDTVVLYPRLYNVLQSRYYDISYSINVDRWTSSQDIKVYSNGSYLGQALNLNSTYEIGSDNELKFYQSIGTCDITVTFNVINSETNSVCITRTVTFKIGVNEDETGVTGSTTNGVPDSSFITSNGSGISSYNDISNMGISDYYNLVDTNNTAWSFFKVILNSLPNWLTLPLSLLIFGVVIITLYRFIRGA